MVEIGDQVYYKNKKDEWRGPGKVMDMVKKRTSRGKQSIYYYITRRRGRRGMKRREPIKKLNGRITKGKGRKEMEEVRRKDFQERIPKMKDETRIYTRCHKGSRKRKEINCK